MLDTSSQPEADHAVAPPVPGSLGELPGRVLLRRFQQTRDKEALAEIVARHTPLVLAACRRGAPTAADVDDAFQATFLVFTQSAAKIRRRDALASWLYGVATRVCHRMRQRAARLPVHEPMDTPSECQDPLDELLARQDETIADEELAALPESLRQPLVLRYLAGKSNAETAAQLGLSVTALEGRLKRGKQRLRMRLLRRGVTLAAIAAALKGSRVAAESLPPELIASTVRLCVAGGSGALTAAGSSSATSTPATTLALEEIAAMPVLTVSKPLVVALLTVAGAAVTAVGPLAFAEGEAVAEPGGVVLNAAVEEAPAAESDAVQFAPAPKANQPAEQGRSSAWTWAGLLDTEDRMGTAVVDGITYTAAGRADRDTNKTLDLKQRTASEVAIEQALEKKLQDGGLDFPEETPLEEVVDYLRAEYEIEIQIDWRALDDLGVSQDELITVSLRGIRLDAAMRLMLRPLDLTYVLKDEVLLITSEDEALTMSETRVYPVDPAKADSLMEAIENTVAPDTWKSNGGGDSTIVSLGDRLVIRQTYHVHAEISELLSQLLRSTPEE